MPRKQTVPKPAPPLAASSRAASPAIRATGTSKRELAAIARGLGGGVAPGPKPSISVERRARYAQPDAAPSRNAVAPSTPTSG
eukprot:scaffold10077_cov31-Tisochrysis_lutea.AAC.1